MWVTSSLSKVLTPTAVALGNFDGVHRGHRQVIQPVLDLAATGKHPYPTVVTFSPHPKEFFTGQSLALLTPKDEKVQQLEAAGVKQLVLLPFDHQIASLSPQQFVETILVQQLQARHICVGANFRFGAKRAGNTADLQAIAAQFGVEVTIVPLEICNGQRISSSAIREALQTGDLSTANRLLGRSYSLVGQVVQGQQLGRTIGFPTANLQVAPEKFIPSYGVYSVWVDLPEQSQTRLPGVINIGLRPTVGGTQLTLEVHLLDWSGDLYGQTIVVHLEQFLRPEQKFASLEALQTQIQADCTAARTQLATI